MAACALWILGAKPGPSKASFRGLSQFRGRLKREILTDVRILPR